MARKDKSTQSRGGAFSVGDRVFVSNGATDGANCTGVIVEENKGWYNVRLDDPEACGKDQVSARAGSMLLEGDAKSALSPATTPARPDVPDDDGEDDDDATERAGEASAMDEDDAAMTAAQRMAEALKKARTRYVKAKRPNGDATANNGDKIARALQDMEPVETAYMADKVCGQTDGFHVGKYGHLNAGQVRMNSGNRIRTAWKTAIAEENVEEMTRIGRLLGFIGEDETAEGLYK